LDIRKFLLLVVAVLVVLLVLGVWFYPVNSDFRVENTFWNGSSDVTSRYDIRPLASLDGLSSLPGGATLIIIPYQDFSPAELEPLGNFIRGGGVLVLADDYGYGNRVLDYLGLRARFSGAVLLDPLVNDKNQQFPRITHLNPDALTANVDDLVFNHATGLLEVAGDEIVAVSSSFSFLDANGNGTPENNETAGPLPVISRHRLGGGQVVLISDPSVFINGMGDIGSNAALIRNIAGSPGGLYIDQSHLIQSGLHQARERLQTARSFASSGGGTAGLVIIGVAASLLPLWRRKKEDAAP
jgi:hypothetical protein